MGRSSIRTLGSVVALAGALIFGCGDEEPTSGGDTTPPADVTDLSVSALQESSATLTWTAPGDDEDQGTASAYDVRYSTLADTLANWWDSLTVAVDGLATPQDAGATENLTIPGLDPDTTYHFALRAADEVPNWSALSNAVQATIPPDPVPQLSELPDTLDFGSTEIVLAVPISNVGTGTLSWSVTTEQRWISVSPTSGTATAETDSLVVTVDRTGLPRDEHAGAVNIASNGGDDSLAVSMIVENVDWPLLSLNQVELDFGDTTTVLTFEISNVGADTLTWSVGDNRTWIYVDPMSGETTTESDTVTVTVNRTNLSAGRYTGTVGIASDGGVTTVSVTMAVPDDWWGTAEFGQLAFIVDGHGTAITEVSFTFLEWQCGGRTRSGTRTSRSQPGWPISGGQFTITTSFESGNLTMTVQGTTEGRHAASGTWTGLSYGTACSGNWWASSSGYWPVIVVFVDAGFDETEGIMGFRWLPGSDVTLEIDRGADGAFDFQTTTRADDEGGGIGEARFRSPPFDVAEGDIIKMYDGITLITHAVEYLTLEQVDREANVLSGSAREGMPVDVGIFYPPRGLEIQVIADATDAWTADFTGAFDIATGTTGWVSTRSSQDARACTQINW